MMGQKKKQQYLFTKIIWIFALLIIIQVSLKPLELQAGPFQSVVSYSVGLGPNGITSADFNGDELMDIAVANVSGNNVSVRLGNADGTFGNRVNYTAENYTFSIANGDFNGDTNIDLVAANRNSDTVSVFFGNGDGTFAGALSIPAGDAPNYIAVADFNGDGNLDFVVSNISSAAVSIVLGNGDGTFGAAVSFAVGSGPYEVATGDFNGDGKLDLAVSNFTGNSVSVLLNNGLGAFPVKVDYGVQSGPNGTAVGDVNGDGNLDLVVSNGGSGSLSVLLGIAGGTFNPAVNYSSGGDDSRGIGIADFTGDGKLDLAVGNFGSGNLAILAGDGNGAFATAVTYSAGSTINDLVSGDFNGDSKLDFAFARQWADDFGVLLSTSANANLQSLSLSGGASLSPAFNTGTLGYTASVANSVSSISVTPTLADATATMTVRIDGGTPEPVTSGLASSALPLSVGTHTIEVAVTAQDGTTKKTYTVSVTRAPSSEAGLSGLSLSAGAALTPAFSAGTLGYTASVLYGVGSISVTPAVADATATLMVRIDGGTPEPVTSGLASGALPLSVGTHTIEVAVTAQDGTTLKTYTISVTREAAVWTGISLDTEDIILNMGATHPVTVSTVSADNPVNVTAETTFSSLNPAVATVDPVGIVTGQTAGTTVINAVYGGYQKQLAVKVLPQLTAIQADTNSYRFILGNTHQTVLTAVYSDSTTIDITAYASYKSSDVSVADVDSGGKVTAKSVGETIITTAYGGKEAQISVTSLRPQQQQNASPSSSAPVITGIRLDTEAYKVAVGDTAQAKVSAIYSNTSTVDVTAQATYTMSAPMVAEVDSLGKLIGKSEGASTLKVLYEGYEATAAVTVINTVTPSPTSNPSASSASCGASQAASMVQFKDVFDHWAENSIKQAAALGFVSGYPDGTFLPGQPITRAEFTVMISCAMNLQEQEQEVLSFMDNEQIPGWAQEAVKLAVGAGIIEGYPDGTFRPDKLITRTEMAKMIVSALKLPTTGDVASFADQDQIPGWANGFIATAQQHKIVDGSNNNLFRPNLNATRAEAVTMLLRMLMNTMK